MTLDEPPNGLIVADVTGDGRPDVVLLTQKDTLEVRPNLGRGAFGPSRVTAVDAHSYSLVTADFDGDGVPDVAVSAGWDQGTVDVLLSRDGGFAPTERLGVMAYPEGLVTADFNGDGIPDLAAMIQIHSGVLDVLLGYGDGGFAPASSFTLWGDDVGWGMQPVPAVAGDFNGDGHVDIALTTAEWGVPIFVPGYGDGGFGSIQPINAGVLSNTTALAAGDLNGDGRTELIVGASSERSTWNGELDYGAEVAVLSAIADGGLGVASSASTAFPINNLYSIAGVGFHMYYPVITGLQTVDAAGDGTLAIVATTGIGLSGLMWPSPDGGLIASTPWLSGGYSSSPQSLAVADVDGDGQVDLVQLDSLDPVPSVRIDRALAQTPGRSPPAALVSASWVITSLAVGDLDEDGRDDLVAGGADLSILANDEQGSVTAPFLVSADSPPEGYFDPIVLADINEDGLLDVVASDGYRLVLTLRAADGTLGSPNYLLVPASPLAIGAADLDGNGHLDLISAGMSSTSELMLETLPGGGDGGFGAVRLTATGIFCDAGATGPFISSEGAAKVHDLSLAVASLTGAPLPDVAVVLAGANQIAIFSSEADGGFGPARLLTTGEVPVALAAADLNGDGAPDLVTANLDGGSLSVFINQGSGRFAPRVDYASGSAPGSVVAADVNGDGAVDLVATDLAVGAVDILLGNGDGTFQPPLAFAAGSLPASVQAIALVPGSLPSLAVAVPFQGVSIIHSACEAEGTTNATAGTTGSSATSGASGGSGGGRGSNSASGSSSSGSSGSSGASPGATCPRDGGFLAPKQVLSSGLNTSSMAVTADFNGDGRLDFATVDQWGTPLGTVTVALGDGAGGVSSVTRYPAGIEPSFLATGDFNGDGHPDLVVSSAAGTVNVLLGLGDGGFSAAVGSPAGGEGALAVGDFNGDGWADLAVGGTATSLLLGNGDGTFQPPRFPMGSSQDVAAGLTLASGDFRGSGLLDLVRVDVDAGEVTVWLGRGDGTFDLGFQSQAQGVFQVITGDFNSDGHLDFLLEGALIATFPGYGDGGFGSPVASGVPGNFFSFFPGPVASGDFDGDGNLDLLRLFTGTQDYQEGSLQLLLGDGTGAFTWFQTVQTGLDPAWLAVGDLNGDGMPDLVVGDANGDAATVLDGDRAGPCPSCPAGGSGTLDPCILDGGAQGACCSSGCTDLSSDAINCGVCGQACDQGEACYAGACFTEGCGPPLPTAGSGSLQACLAACNPAMASCLPAQGGGYICQPLCGSCGVCDVVELPVCEDQINTATLVAQNAQLALGTAIPVFANRSIYPVPNAFVCQYEVLSDGGPVPDPSIPFAALVACANPGPLSFDAGPLVCRSSASVSATGGGAGTGTGSATGADPRFPSVEDPRTLGGHGFRPRDDSMDQDNATGSGSGSGSTSGSGVGTGGATGANEGSGSGSSSGSNWYGGGSCPPNADPCAACSALGQACDPKTGTCWQPCQQGTTVPFWEENICSNPTIQQVMAPSAACTLDGVMKLATCQALCGPTPPSVLAQGSGSSTGGPLIDYCAQQGVDLSCFAVRNPDGSVVTCGSETEVTCVWQPWSNYSACDYGC